MYGQGAPGQHYGIDFLPQTGPKPYDSLLPQSLLQSPLGLPAALYLQPMMQQAATDMGYLPGQLSGTQNYFDNLRGMRYQQHGMEAQSKLAKADIRASEDFFAGVGQLGGIYGAGFRDESRTDKKSIEGRKHFNSLMETLEDNSDFIMIADMMMPGLGIMDTLTAGKGGASRQLGQYMQMANQRRIDPTTGQRGLSGESIFQQTQAIQEELYGGLSDDPASNALIRQRIHGLKLGRIGEGIAAFDRRGLGPSSISGKLDQEEIADIRQGILKRKGSEEPLTGDALRKMSGDKDLSQEAMAELADNINKNKDLDVSLRQFDASKTAEWAKKMSGVVSAMSDVFGPGKPIEQMLTQLNQLTQNSLANKSLGEVENIARRLKSGMSASGLDWQQTARLTAVAADVIQQGGGQREDAVFSTLHTQAFTANFTDSEGAANDALSFAGMDPSELALKNTMLHAGAATSPVNNQLGMLVRMSEIGEGFKEGSEMDLRVKAIKKGEETYIGKDNKRRSVYSRSHDELGAFIEESSDNAITKSDASHMITQTSVNFEAGGAETANLTRAMQKEEDVVPAMESGIRRVLDKTVAKKGTTEALANILVEFDPSFSDDEALAELDKAGWDAARMKRLEDPNTGEIDSHKAKEAVLKSRFVTQLKDAGLSAEEAEVQAEKVWGAMVASADEQFKLDARSLFALFSNKNTDVHAKRDDGTTSGTGEHLAKQKTDAAARKKLAGIGEEGFLAKIASAIAQVGESGEKADFKTVLADVMGVDTEGVLAVAADKGWDKDSRDRIEELIISDAQVRDELTEELGRAPTPEEITEERRRKLKELGNVAEKRREALAKAQTEKVAKIQSTIDDKKWNAISMDPRATWEQIEEHVAKTKGLRTIGRNGEHRYWQDGKRISADEYDAAAKKMIAADAKANEAKNTTEDTNNQLGNKSVPAEETSKPNTADAEKEAETETPPAEKNNLTELGARLLKHKETLLPLLEKLIGPEDGSALVESLASASLGGTGGDAGSPKVMELAGTLDVNIETGKGELSKGTAKTVDGRHHNAQS